MSISKRLRYEVLRRDGFKCWYCKAADVELTVDHVVPQILGGTDDPSNLVTACGPCNSGKTSSMPDAAFVPAVHEDVAAWAQSMRQQAGRTLMDEGRLELARELLNELGDDEREYFLKQADMSEYQDEDDEPQTESQQACEAMAYALNSLRCDWDYLAGRVEDTLRNLPGKVGERALAPREDKFSDSCGPYARRTFRLTDSLIVADDLLNLPAAQEYLDTLTEPERAEWRTYAASLYCLANLDDDQLTSRAGQCAWTIAEGGWWNDMCIGRGTVIEHCPQRGTHRARIAESKCCGPDGPADHKGHLVCDGHLDELLEGTFEAETGKPFSASDYATVGSDPWDF